MQNERSDFMKIAKRKSRASESQVSSLLDLCRAQPDCRKTKPEVGRRCRPAEAVPRSESFGLGAVKPP